MDEAFEKTPASNRRDRRPYGMFKKPGVLWWTLLIMTNSIAAAATFVFLTVVFG